MRLFLTLLPFLWIILALPLVNSLEPRIGGIPFVAFWIQCGVVLTVLCIHTLYKMDKKKREAVRVKRD